MDSSKRLKRSNVKRPVNYSTEQIEENEEVDGPHKSNF